MKKDTISNRILTRRIAEETNLTIERVRELQEISIDDAVQRFLPEDVLLQMISQRAYCPPEENKDAHAVFRRYIHNHINLRSGKLVEYFQNAINDGKQWYSVNAPSREIIQLGVDLARYECSVEMNEIEQAQTNARAKIAHKRYSAIG